MTPRPQPQAEPRRPDPVRIPNPLDADVIQAERERMRREFAGRAGRESTDLTGGSSTYDRTTLG